MAKHGEEIKLVEPRNKQKQPTGGRFLRRGVFSVMRLGDCMLSDLVWARFFSPVLFSEQRASLLMGLVAFKRNDNKVVAGHAGVENPNDCQ
jgi:hypothetical protein